VIADRDLCIWTGVSGFARHSVAIESLFLCCQIARPVEGLYIEHQRIPELLGWRREDVFRDAGESLVLDREVGDAV
jgi:hypothetical protein